MVAWGGVIHESIVNHPPRGTSLTTVRMGDKRMHQWTYLCPVDECWAMAYSDISEDSAKAQVANHNCPSPMRRGIMPGSSILEKMWDTADEAVDALHTGVFYLSEDMIGEKLKGFIAGVAEMISYAAIPYFRIPEDVLREMQRRWKMRQHLIPFSPTPSYRYNPPSPEIYKRDEGPGARPVPATRTPATKAPTKRAVRAARVAVQPVTVADPKQRPLSGVDTESIRNAVKAGMSYEDLAKAYNITEARVEQIVHPQVMIIGGLF